MKRIVLTLLVAGWVAGCRTPAPDVTTHYDAVSGLRTDLMSDNLLETESGSPPREVVWLNASRVFIDYRDSRYFLEVTYMATDEVGFLEIPAGETLTLTLDGKAMRLKGTGSANLRKREKNLLREVAIYEVTREQLQRIATANEVKVGIQGRNGLVQREFKEPNFKKFQKFVTFYAL